MLVKLCIKRGPDVADEADAANNVVLIAGGILAIEDEVLCHYTTDGERAAREWKHRGFVVINEREVAMGPEGLSRLQGDLEERKL